MSCSLFIHLLQDILAASSWALKNKTAINIHLEAFV